MKILIWVKKKNVREKIASILSSQYTLIGPEAVGLADGGAGAEAISPTEPLFKTMPSVFSSTQRSADSDAMLTRGVSTFADLEADLWRGDGGEASLTDRALLNLPELPVFAEFICIIADINIIKILAQHQKYLANKWPLVLIVSNSQELEEIDGGSDYYITEIVRTPIQKKELLWRIERIRHTWQENRQVEFHISEESIGIDGTFCPPVSPSPVLTSSPVLQSVAASEVESITQNQYLFRSLVEGIRDYAIFMLDTFGRVATWNTGARRILWYEAREILGQHFSCFYPEEDIKTGKPGQELQLVATAGQCEDEGWRRRADGTYFWANMTITALQDEKGAKLGFSAIIHDLSDRATIESELCSLNRALSTICSCHQAIVRAETETQLLQDICQLIVQIGKYPLAWVGLVPSSPESPTPMHCAAYASTLGDETKRDKIALELIANSSESAYNALFTASPSIIQNSSTNRSPLLATPPGGSALVGATSGKDKDGDATSLDLSSKSSLICLPLCHTGGLIESGDLLGPPDQGTREPPDQGTREPGDHRTREPGNQGTTGPGDQETTRPGPGTTRPGTRTTRPGTHQKIPGVSQSPRLPVTPSPHPPIPPSLPPRRRCQREALRRGSPLARCRVGVASAKRLGGGHPVPPSPSCLGVLTIYATVAEAFDPQEIELLSELASDLAYGILALRTRDRSLQTEAALRESEERYRQLVEMLPDTILIHQQGHIEYINPAGVQLLGLNSPILPPPPRTELQTHPHWGRIRTLWRTRAGNYQKS